eukprot:305296-Amphidinium_carterae.1
MSLRIRQVPLLCSSSAQHSALRRLLSFLRSYPLSTSYQIIWQFRSASVIDPMSASYTSVFEVLDLPDTPDMDGILQRLSSAQVQVTNRVANGFEEGQYCKITSARRYMYNRQSLDRPLRMVP